MSSYVVYFIFYTERQSTLQIQGGKLEIGPVIEVNINISNETNDLAVSNLNHHLVYILVEFEKNTRKMYHRVHSISIYQSPFKRKTIEIYIHLLNLTP